MNTENQKNIKRRRSINTTREQYEMYLSFMENDYVFRSNIINPTLGENYINKKWEELTQKLNAIGNGPHLKIDEWKKRFSDWKYSTRSKYRKITEHRCKTGAGPHSTLIITDIEERALAVWGKVVVTGASSVTQYDGIMDVEYPTSNATISIEEDITEKELHSVIPHIIIQTNTPTEQPTNGNKDPYTPVNRETTQTQPSSSQPNEQERNKNVEKHTPVNKLNTKQPYGKRIRVKPLSVLAEQLLKNNNEFVAQNSELNNILKTFSENYNYIEREKLEFKKSKLRFEIAKFKFGNPEFDL